MKGKKIDMAQRGSRHITPNKIEYSTFYHSNRIVWPEEEEENAQKGFRHSTTSTIDIVVIRLLIFCCCCLSLFVQSNHSIGHESKNRHNMHEKINKNDYHDIDV